MKHPSNEILQDYFEGLTNETLSNNTHVHLEKCDQCSTVLSEMAMVDQAFIKAALPEIEQALEERILQAAAPILNKRKERALAKKKRDEKRDEEIKEFFDAIKGLGNFILNDAKTPALQMAGLSALALFMAQASLLEEETIKYKPVDNKVRSYESSK